MRSITKAQFLVKETADLPQTMADAFHIAATGRPGPIVVDIPMPVQRGAIKFVTKTQPLVDPPLPSIDISSVEAIESLLRDAQQPVIIAGQGVLISNAVEELRKLVDLTGIPVSHSLLALGALPTKSPLALGFHGHTGNQYAGMAIHHADLVLVLGSRLDIRQTGSAVSEFAPESKIVRVDLDIAELEHSRVRQDMVLHANVADFLRLLNQRLFLKPFSSRTEWISKISGWRNQFPLIYANNGPLKPQYIIETANRLTEGKIVTVVTGVGSHQQWAARHFDYDLPTRKWLTSGGHGAMGFDLPAAFGSQLTDPESLVVCFVGDGSLQINIQELAAIVEFGLPIKIVVLDNHRLGIISQFQKLNWKDDPTCGAKWNPDFASIAKAYGIKSFSISTTEQAESILKQAFDLEEPVLVHCLVDPMEDVSPMLMAGKSMDKMWPYHE
jgi:acetolactate synthase-1/2/3 large subunit